LYDKGYHIGLLFEWEKHIDEQNWSRLKSSPTEVKWILLPAFQKNHIQILFENHFTHVVKMENPKLESEFVSLLADYSGGIPRLIEYFFNTLSVLKCKIEEKIHFQSFSEIETLMTKLFEWIGENALDFIHFSEKETDKELRLATMLLYVSSVSGATFNVNETLPGTSHPLRELIPRIPFYITGKDNECKIIHPKIRYLYLEKSFKGETYYSYLSALHSHTDIHWTLPKH
jgi:hypothetical protein